ncbi:4a-hydroxytetrahydrobiopterin dehydratase [Patescibacteria group bacterium]|uniref:Putative pterin-4-alpha-carbinolamine dehydratase n=1 Tax=candidate division WWE3 bacterium TaxID=2053526 RepID=A0A928Y511_UNCKA|nr:4a-hydroxytetrahydrobiopterin dehydratase [candidate division WWE3 bacterium]MCL4732406.1 4a-hydroxytetrahydrobiopterin dehydratase [Patescibacteria group bacterium]MDL1952832.1 4a-hydroxytetrahydrobiopterin dehydratase [Candidatus Uhrbacteria bacterium UHB]RIL01068.1 MAG: 4a-hydroxytetrahydrobiopterin dehydratase [Candidatus Uhrbacteria bacterium]
MSTSILSEHCVPCEGGIAPLTRELSLPMLQEVPGWQLSADAKQLSRTFAFRDFPEALSFINRIGSIAEQEGHHPDIHNFWNTVRLDLTTHAIGGLSRNDFILAAKINQLQK